MPQGVLSINGYDAYKRWGISMKETGLTALMTPAPSKARVENRYRIRNGKSVSNHMPRVDTRDLTLEIHMYANSRQEFFDRYNDFCENVLSTGVVDIVTSYASTVCYHCLYVSCQQFSEFDMRYASFALRLEEPDPTSREVTDEQFKEPTV